ncbi:MAG TPA: alpha/beta hydrolase [Fimbriimonas sp.]
MAEIAWTPTVLKARDGTSQTAERGEISVVEDRSANTGCVRLRFVRIRATEPANAPPVVFLSGGPGESGIQWASHGPFLRAFQRVARSVDLLLLDQRGTGSSDRDLTVSTPAFGKEDLVSKESMLSALERHLAARIEEVQAVGRAYTAVDSCRDLVDLQDALGVGQLSLWAYSYGTHLAQMALKLHSKRIRRAVLCGFEGPNQTFKLPHNLDAQIARLDFFYPGLEDSLRSAFDRLERDPVDVDGVRFGAFAFRHLVANWCGLSNRFPRLPALAESLAAGDPDVMRANLKDYARIWARPYSFYLADAASGATKARWEEIRAQEPFSLLEDATNFPFPEVGQTVQAADIGDQLRSPLKTDVPMLVLTGSLDGFTPTENAMEGMRTLKRAEHILIENAAHNDLLGTDEGLEAIARFLADGSLPTISTLVISPPPR